MYMECVHNIKQQVKITYKLYSISGQDALHYYVLADWPLTCVLVYTM